MEKGGQKNVASLRLAGVVKGEGRRQTTLAQQKKMTSEQVNRPRDFSRGYASSRHDIQLSRIGWRAGGGVADGKKSKGSDFNIISLVEKTAYFLRRG